MARGSPGRLGAVAAIVAGIGSLSAAPPASAGDETLGTENGLTYLRDSTPIAAGATATQIVQCPVGQKLLGGGADSVSTQTGGLLNVARPNDGGDANEREDDSYYAVAYNSTGVPGETLVWAVCAPGKSRVRTRTAKLPFAATKTVRASCPDGTKVVGGGALATGEVTDAQLKATRPFDSDDRGRKLDDGWLARASNVGPGPREVWATAVCRAGLAPTYFGALSEFPISQGAAGDSCPDPPNPVTSVSGAGGEVRGQGSTVRISAVLPVDNGIEVGTVPDDGVVVEAQNFSPDAEDEYAPFGACLALPP